MPDRAMKESENGSVVGVVYGLHLGDYKYRYVGLTTTSVEERMSRHRRAFSSKYPVHCWMRKHFATVRSEVLETIYTSRDDLREAERKWIVVLQTSVVHGGLNIMNGGELSRGMLGINHSDAAKAKMSASLKGRTFSPVTIQRMSESAKVRVRDESFFADENYRQRMRQSTSEMWKSSEHRAKVLAALSVKYQCDECSYVSNAGNVAQHQKRVGHVGRSSFQ